MVAGERDTTVIRDDGRRFAGTVVAFDPDRDLALRRRVRVRAAGPARAVRGDAPTVRSAACSATRAVSRCASPRSGSPVRSRATGRDIYGSGTTERQVLELAADLRPGDSGSPLVDPDGEVVGVAFAIARDQADVAYALATSELLAVLADPLGHRGLDRPLPGLTGPRARAASGARSGPRCQWRPGPWSERVGSEWRLSAAAFTRPR